MTDYQAKIRAKGLDATGVTETIASDMYARKGGYWMGIVEMQVDETHDKADGKRKVDLVLTQVEPCTDSTLEDHLRELTRTLAYNRKVADDDGQPTLDGGDDIEPKVADVLKAGARFEPHPYLSAQLSTDDEPVCDVCGQTEDAVVHHMPARDPFAVDDHLDVTTDPDDEDLEDEEEVED